MVRDPKRRARKDLKSLLGKLGIRSAEQNHFAEMMEDMVESAFESFGRPDELIMPGSALTAILEALAKENK